MKGLPRYDLNTKIVFLCMIGVGVTMSFISIEAQGVNISTTAQGLLALKESELSMFVDAVESNARNCDAPSGCSGANCSRLSCYKFGTADTNYECLGVANNTFCNVSGIAPCTHRTFDFSKGFIRYRESTYVPKVVSLLIDCGLNMRTTIIAADAETYISKAIATAFIFLDTLTEDRDYVTIMCFDGDGIIFLNDTMTYNRQLLYQSFNNSLSQIVLNGSKSDPTAAQTNNAINVTINQLNNSDSIPASYLKVVIALIGGQQYADIQDLDFSIIPNMNVFIYNFRTQKKNQSQCDPAIRASIEEIPIDMLSNPLYALQSYYSFLAKLHRSFMKNLTDYGPQYQDFSGVDAHTLTLSKAAFGPNGELLGVLGLDFFEFLVEEQFPTIQFASIVEEAGKHHDPGRSFDTSIDLNINVCYNHTDACPGLDTDYGPGFLCEKATSPDENIGCCGTCKVSTTPSSPPSMPPTSPPKKITLWIKVVAGVVGAEGGLIQLSIAAILVIILVRRRAARTLRVSNGDLREYSGSD